MTEKRVQYFNGQFLQEEDFRDEQLYHIDRQRRHNRALHTPGIAEGLTVTANVGASEVEVSSGTAIDGDGQVIVLDDSRTVDIRAEHQNETVLLVISYNEEGSNPATVGGSGATRTHERPNVELLVEGAAPSPDTHIRLARIDVTSGGTVGAPHQTDVRANAGVRLGGELELRRLTLSRENVDPSQWPTVTSSAAGQADVTGDLHVTGTLSANVLADNLVDTSAVADGAVTVAKLSTQEVASNTITINAGSTETVPISTAIPIAEVPALTQILVSAFSPTPGARFSWYQGSITHAVLASQQVVFFRNEGAKIEVQYTIHVLKGG